MPASFAKARSSISGRPDETRDMAHARRHFLQALAASGLLGTLSGCDKLLPAKSPFKSIDVTGSALGGELRLTDHAGKPRSLADFRGKVVVVFFGFTQCPDVCPTALADAAAAVRELGEDGRQVQVLFVTLDPRRDTQELLAQYTTAFHPDFLGLRGDAAAIERAKKEFGVYSSERAGKATDDYTIEHSAQLFVLDRGGRMRLVVPPGLGATSLASDLRILLNS